MFAVQWINEVKSRIFALLLIVMPDLKKYLLSFILIIVFVLGCNKVFGQAATCLCSGNQMNATPFCTDQNPYGLTYAAGTSGYATELYYLNSQGCIDEYDGGENPAWFKMKISQAGNLTINMSHGGGGDIDYACWGPFTDADMNNMCVNWTTNLRNYLYDNLATDYPSTYYTYYSYSNGLQIFSHHPTYYDYYQSYPYANSWYTDWYNPNPSGKLVDCSSTPSPSEIIHIRNAQVGEWYIVLISNWAGYSGNITFARDASSTAQTDCSITAPVTGDEVCEGETATLTAQAVAGAVHYAWTGPNNFSQTTTTSTLTISNVTQSMAGTYSMRVWNGGSYGDATTCELIVHPSPSLVLNDVETCIGQPVTLTVSGAETYLWNTGSTTATISVIPQTTTTYTVTGTTGGMCTATASATVTVGDAYEITLTDTICQGGSYNESGFNVDANTAGDFTYQQELQTLSGCDSNVTLHLTVLPAVVIDEYIDICEGESYLFYGNTYTTTGVYEQHFPTQDGCDSVIKLHLNANQSYQVVENRTICNTDLPYYYRPADTTFGEGTAENATYYFNRYTAAGCDSSITLTLSIVESTLELNNLTEDFCEEREAVLQVITPLQNIQWSTGESEPEIRVHHPGTYYVSAYTGQCRQTAQVFIEQCDFDLYLPNGITPTNEDGVNDVFFIPEFTAAQMSHFEISIYDRWGKIVFHSEDPYFHWDGSENGKIKSGSTYVYRIYFWDVNGTPTMAKGIVTVL